MISQYLLKSGKVMEVNEIEDMLQEIQQFTNINKITFD